MTRDDNTERTRGVRFWAIIIIVVLLNFAIGASSQRTYYNTEKLSRETRQFADQTNDCLRQLLAVQAQRNEISDKIAKIGDRRDDVTNNFIVGITGIINGPHDGTTPEKIRNLVAVYTRDSDKVSEDSANLIAARAANQIPDPNCTSSTPGHD